jgi:Rieske Fe-S protein
MVVVNFDPGRFNYVVAGDASYFLLQLPDGSRVLFRDRCDHRGGPLHLGCWDEDAGGLVCPSHRTRYAEKVLRKQGVPLIYRAGRATAVLDVPPQAAVSFARKNILAQPR